ncbi:TPA: hypothetical protein VDW83_006184, partial [Pseudomonas aeruginosa]|nr:hypothetical protein [Pseudomonas aeruginosa]
MTNANECTCPSGDGSLRHPCPAHPAPVEQAGGDERDGWGPFPIVQVPWNVFDRAVMWVEDRRRYGDDGTIVDDWKALKTIQRAALAQPSPVSEALIYACKNLAQITSSDGSGHADIAMAVLRMAGVGDDERERLVNEWKAARAWKPSPAQAEGAPVVGCLCGMPMTEGHHSQDGCCNLEEFAQQAQAEQAEAERPEVVAYFDRNYPSTGDAFIWSNYEGSPYEPVMTVAQHGRISAQLHDALDECDGDRWKLRSERDAANARLHEVATACATAEQERDAALAKVAGLELKLDQSDYAYDNDRCHMRGLAKQAAEA